MKWGEKGREEGRRKKGEEKNRLHGESNPQSSCHSSRLLPSIVCVCVCVCVCGGGGGGAVTARTYYTDTANLNCHELSVASLAVLAPPTTYHASRLPAGSS